MKSRIRYYLLERISNAKIITVIISCSMVMTVNKSTAQQFNSDSWLSKKHGTITIIPTFGQRNSMLMNTYSLIPKWEFTMAAYLYNHDDNAATNDGYSTSFYVKYMFYENKEKTGGAAVKVGTGLFPGNLDEEEAVKDAFKTYWVNAPVTLPFMKNRLQWDIMPGASMTRDYGSQQTTAVSFTYSTRLAWYPFNDKGSIVSELFGVMGTAATVPEYKIGFRWEPNQYAVFALTYGNEINGHNGAGFEFGIMLFTPPFACLGGCATSTPKKKN
jgi:hypothetical protein